MKMVLFPAVEAERESRLRAAAGPTMTVVSAGSEGEALQHMPDTEAFFGKITPPLLAAAARKLRWVQAPTVSLEHYLFPELVAHPCVLTNMRGLFSDVIADQVMGYVLCFARNLHRYVLAQSRGEWQPLGGEKERVANSIGPATISGIDRMHRHLGGSTMGVVGLGAIGAEIARRALAFNMRVIAVDPSRIAVPPGVESVWPLERLPELLCQSDYVAIAAPHTPQTVKMFRRAQFQQMKRSAYLINIGRGVIVDLGDLVAALQADEIAGAALDVFETEPLPASSPLWGMGDRVIVTPHVAGYATCIAARHLAVVEENVGRFVRGEELVNVCDKSRWY
jgi:phosphoglycerate dehydrogenase-like enzyme